MFQITLWMLSPIHATQLSMQGTKRNIMVNVRFPVSLIITYAVDTNDQPSWLAGAHSCLLLSSPGDYSKPQASSSSSSFMFR